MFNSRLFLATIVAPSLLLCGCSIDDIERGKLASDVAMDINDLGSNGAKANEWERLSDSTIELVNAYDVDANPRVRDALEAAVTAANVGFSEDQAIADVVAAAIQAYRDSYEQSGTTN